MPSKVVFLDANGWVALLNEEDALHAPARDVWRNLGRQGYSIVLTDWVIAETGNGLARSPARRGFAAAVQRLRSSPHCRILSVGLGLMQRALELYDKRPDKRWGLVDCASFLVMSDERVTEALTTDHHFEQAGFACLLPVGDD